MAKWSVYGTVTGGKYLGEVEAKTKKEAIEKGWELDTISVSVCHQCSDQIEDPEIHGISVDRVPDEAKR